MPPEKLVVFVDSPAACDDDDLFCEVNIANRSVLCHVGQSDINCLQRSSLQVSQSNQRCLRGIGIHNRRHLGASTLDVGKLRLSGN